MTDCFQDKQLVGRDQHFDAARRAGLTPDEARAFEANTIWWTEDGVTLKWRRISRLAGVGRAMRRSSGASAGPRFIAPSDALCSAILRRFAVLARQCLDRRIDSFARLVAETAEEKRCNAPREHLNKKQVRTVGELLDDAWETYLKKLPSAEAAGIARDILKREMGDKRLAALVLQNFDDFRDRLKAQRKSIGYVSRILSVLRSSANRAFENKKVPEYQPRSKKKNLKKKGPLLTFREIAAIIDEINDQHLLLLLILLIHLGARVGAILNAIKAQIDLEQNRFDLNPPDRETTNKGRPVLPIPITLRPWLEDLPDGPLITYRGAAIAEADAAFNSAVHRSKIGKKANTYSIRHSLSRYMRNMRKKRVDLEEIGIYLGHGNHDPETTLIYCPWEPEYLVNCRKAAEAFVREINTYTRKWDLLRPYSVKPNYVEN